MDVKTILLSDLMGLIYLTAEAQRRKEIFLKKVFEILNN